MMDGKVSGLGVVVSPWCEVIVSLAGPAVNLDLNATHGLRKKTAGQIEDKGKRWSTSAVRVRESYIMT